MNLLKTTLFVVLSVSIALATTPRQRVQGNCEKGNEVVVTPGSQNSTTKVQRSYPSCTVTIYDAGTLNLSTIYSDDAGTAKANPFTAATDGYWFFYANDGHYDVKLSGAGISAPFTRGDYQASDYRSIQQDMTILGKKTFSAETTFQSKVSISAAGSEPTLGSELVTNGTFVALTGWTDSGVNWSDLGGAHHVAGVADTLSQTVAVVNGKTYVITFTVLFTSGDSVTIDVGGTQLFMDGPVTGFYGTGTYSRTLVAPADNATLTITPSANFVGTVTTISVKELPLNSVVAALTLNNSDGSTGVQFRAGGVGLSNVYVGNLAGISSIGNYNTVVGPYAFAADTTGYNDVVIGYNAMASNTVGYQNVAVGANALQSNTSGSGVTAVGYNALQDNTTGYDNQAFGEYALWHNTTGYAGTALGMSALRNNTSGSWNTAVGVSALYQNTTGDTNVAVGYNALFSSTTSSANTAVGVQSLLGLTGGNNNTAVGSNSGKSITTGNLNTAVGSQALYSTTSGIDNVAIGDSALYANATASDNVAVGANALYSNLVGTQGVAVGVNALHASTADQNTAVGYNALQSTTTGNNNTALGNQAGSANTTGTFNTWVGYQAGSANTGLTNATAIGSQAANTASNQVVLGNASVNQICFGSGVCIYAGPGVPGINCAIGSLYLSSAGGAATTLYVCTALNTWTAK